LLPFLIWTQLIGASAWWSVYTVYRHADETAEQRGRDLFSVIQLTRAWNAGHAGIYAVRSDRAIPNPYLKTPNRDLVTQQGLELTMINPAYMTRQISELARTQGFYFHITSNKPLRPANAPDAWERRALDAFEQGERERIELLEGTTGHDEFRYMAPLRVTPPCLGCHAIQGYQLGQIRGGISINVDATPILERRNHQLVKTGIAHAGVWLLVAILIFLTMRMVRIGIVSLDDTRISQGRTIARKNQDLKKAQQQITKLQNSDALTGFSNREFFEKALQESLDKAEASDRPFGVLIVELDFFNEYNTEYGILEGDIVLRMIAALLIRETSITSPLFCRYIGSSFAIGLFDINEKPLREYAEKLRQAIYQLGIKHEHSTAARFVTATIGVAHRRAGAQTDAESLLKSAALAMYKGKKKGRNCVVAA
jgi:diguanylate cyclase (GGDEF)-like protein